MPRALARACRQPGCPALTLDKSGYCDKHKRDTQRRYDKERGSAAERGYDERWRKARASFLRANPLCVECAKKGYFEPATVVDHIVPHKGDRKLFWDRSNWQPLCKRCHDSKTAREDGRWG